MASNRSTKLPKEKAYSGVDMSGVTMTLDEIMAPIRAGRKDLLPVDLLPVDLLPGFAPSGFAPSAQVSSPTEFQSLERAGGCSPQVAWLLTCSSCG